MLSQHLGKTAVKGPKSFVISNTFGPDLNHRTTSEHLSGGRKAAVLKLSARTLSHAVPR
jgi:hypothetical protein